VTLRPQITLKQFEQQLPLSYYYVNTSQKIVDDDFSKVMVE